MDPTVDVVTAFQLIVVGQLVALAGLAVARAWRGRPAGWWAAAAFGSLGMALAAVWLPAWLEVELPVWVDRGRLVALLAFPYLLLRFTASFRPLPRLLEVAAAAVGVASALAVAGDGPAALAVALGLTYWVGVSIVVVVRLWRAGQGQPGVARRRMRWMAVATALFTVALLVALGVVDVPLVSLVTHGLVLASVSAFAVGFAPPRALRLSWRRAEDEQVVAATGSLLRVTTVEAVAEQLLPPTMAIMGASGVVLLDTNGRVAARAGVAPDVGAVVDTTVPVGMQVADLGGEHGQLVAWTSAYSPFFGPEERGLFHSLAAVGGLAMDRCLLLDEERSARTAAEQAHQDADTARREAEQARAEADAANLAKSEFLSRMSHELRTPLNAVLGFGQLLELADLDDDDRDAVAHILKAGRHLLALIDDVLDLSRIEAGTLTISPEPVHAAELVRDSIALVVPLAQPRGIRITQHDDSCDWYVHTDRQRCRQILLNLLSNAVKYNHDHGAVDVACTVVDDATLRIAVRDTGPGIDPARQHRLFQPFDRLDAEATGVQGTGLGLALTRQLVERLGGAIGVDSAPGQGATFWVDLPITDAPAELDEPAPPVPTADRAAHHQILLVEDNLANLRVVEMTLNRQRPDVSVLPAMQGTIALELAYEHRPTMVLLDLHLPDMSGRDVLARLQADPRTRDIPVVIATADATPGRMRQLRDDGAFDYLAKPFDLPQLLQVIDAAIAASPR